MGLRGGRADHDIRVGRARSLAFIRTWRTPAEVKRAAVRIRATVGYRAHVPLRPRGQSPHTERQQAGKSRIIYASSSSELTFVVGPEWLVVSQLKSDGADVRPTETAGGSKYYEVTVGQAVEALALPVPYARP